MSDPDFPSPAVAEPMVIQDFDFRFRHPVSVRFRDVDVGGHAHHSEALIYMEEARAAYWEHVTGLAGLDAINYVLAEATIRYHQRVLWPDTLDVGVRVVRLGRKHFEMAYAVESPDRGRLVSARTVQVMYDYEAGRSMRMPDELRARIEALDGPFPGSEPAGPSDASRRDCKLSPSATDIAAEPMPEREEQDP